MNDRNQEAGSWQPLPPGSLVQYAARQQADDHRRKAVRVLLTLLAGLGAAGLIYQVAPESADPQPVTDVSDPVHAGIACSVVRSELDEYARGELSEGRMRTIERHLAECPPCRRILDQLQAAGDGSGRMLLGMAETEAAMWPY